MIKLIIFDLDGVLIDTKNIHYEALNSALDPEYKITWEDHIRIYDGLKTIQKLEILSKIKNLPKDLYQDIWDKKQKLTLEKIKSIEINKNLSECIRKLSEEGFKISVCSNSIRKSIVTILSKIGIIEYIDLIVSNEDVLNSKPHPEMYWKCVSMFEFFPEEVLILEDSPYGLHAAHRSGCNVLRISKTKDVTYEKIKDMISQTEISKINIIPKWEDKRMNVLIPMAGAGSRFKNAGYTFPKPLIDVMGKPMIQIVAENINIKANYIYILLKEHRKKYNLDTLLNLITPGCQIIETDGITEGAACTCLLAKETIDNDSPLFIANSDQFVEWNSNDFMYKMQESDCDGGIVTFKSIHPKWSFVKINNMGIVEKVAEKDPISDNATAGFYYWKRGKDFVEGAEKMIEKNIRVNQEFYVCPVYNQLIEMGKIVKTFEVEKMWGLGTPEDLNYYLENHRLNK